MTKKLSIGILFGGRSSEHEASLASAASVLKHLKREKFDLVPIGITQTGQWMTQTTPYELQGAYPDQIHHPPLQGQSPNTQVVDISTHGLPIMQHPLSSVTQKIDVIFPLLHGTYGEDGKLQGLLEMIGIPYVGCGVLGGAISMDKEKTKQILQSIGLPVVDYKAYRRAELERNPEAILDDIEERFDYPCFVKPANGGSSIGVSKVRSREELRKAAHLATFYDHKILVEKAINCREVECAILGNEDLQASVVGEVIIRDECDFYDYHAKYIEPSTKIIPAQISDNLTYEIQQQSIKAFRALDLTSLARFDFFLEKETQNIYINEVNTLPSFTEDCMYPKLCEASGLAYPDLLERLIELAVESYEDRQRNAAS
ncbi:D-alanine--D-alanine ligase family protein [Dictyobacter arantiisoli]|uniref:D-alanine--D-alanine ligase n=1 Tax=Dictyobacter arantiisoli TaxID=2014874 RepID=A0A5A5T786_9CHLR|nr:D-alanine--D-alanine ligase family protein [Dictyobacter arantiisoli]GCF07272.1 D-alanine--D-alanine ligase A [Dictyobacter arantiisoli]